MLPAACPILASGLLTTGCSSNPPAMAAKAKQVWVAAKLCFSYQLPFRCIKAGGQLFVMMMGIEKSICPFQVYVECHDSSQMT